MTTFICPLCQSPFQLVNKTQVCASNHHFDIAKEGYLNLLPVNAKRSKDPGDSKEMMNARRGFLNSNSYQPLAEKVMEIVKTLLVGINKPQLLDLGCGEGYYTNLLTNSLPEQVTVNALDISKIAIRYAAKRNKRINFCVASAYQVPMADNSLDLLLRIYAPSSPSELQRLIKPDGYLVTVTPAPRHLFELRARIYQQVNEHQQENPSPTGFTKVEQFNLNYPLQITDKQVMEDLVKMTPFYWKFTEQKMTELLTEGAWQVECDFNIEVYKRLEG